MSNNTPAIANPARTQAILNRHHMLAKHSLGQNFLVNVDILNKIVDAADVNENDNVIEIGPGIGGLTEQLAKRANKVIGFEIDQKLLPVLDETLRPYDNIKIINEDILKANLPEVIENEFGNDKPVKVVANLPYYITTPIIMDLLKGNANFDSIVVMMQKEVADRLTAQAGQSAYSSLSVLMQYENDVEAKFNVSKRAFIPSPKVDSSIVKINRKPQIEYPAFDNDKFSSLVRGCFTHRRKTLFNNLKSFLGKDNKDTVKEVLDELSIDPKLRPERLSIDNYVDLADTFHDRGLL